MAYELLKAKLSGEQAEAMEVLMSAARWVLPSEKDVDVKTLAAEAGAEGGRYDCDRSWLERFRSIVVARRTEECAQLMNLKSAQILLMAGEMTADELLTVKAVLAERERVIRNKASSA